MMDSIIKTTRVSPTSFALGVRQHKPNIQAKLEKNPPKPEANANTQTQKPTPATATANSQGLALAQKAAQDSSRAGDALEKPVQKPIDTAAPSARETSERDHEREKRELQEAYDKAKQEGYQAGHEAGKAQGQQELTQAANQVKALLHALKDLDEALFQEMEDTAAEVVFEAVTKIIGQAAVDKNIVLGLVRQAIEHVRGRERLIVRVSSKDHDLVSAAFDDAHTGESCVKGISVVADNLVQLGGCMIETEAGSLDARLEIQLQRLKEILLGVRKSNDDA